MKNRIKHLRSVAGMTQTELAERSGVHVQTISKLERGDRDVENLTVKTAEGLASALHTSFEGLLKETNMTDYVQAGEEFRDALMKALDRDQETLMRNFRANFRNLSRMQNLKDRDGYMKILNDFASRAGVPIPAALKDMFSPDWYDKAVQFTLGLMLEKEES